MSTLGFDGSSDITYADVGIGGKGGPMHGPLTVPIVQKE